MEPTNEPQPVEAPEVEPTEPTEPQTFDAEYVTKLRAEAAEHRTKAKDEAERGEKLFELVKSRTAEQATAGILRDATDLPADGDYLDDETGMPSVEKMRTAAEVLAEAKPWLALPRGDIKQGAQESAPAMPSFGDLMRAAQR